MPEQMTPLERAHKAMSTDAKELLAEVLHQSSLWSSKGAVTRTLGSFASLLSKLSKDATEQTNQNLEIQRQMLRWTRKVFYLSIGLAVISALQVLLGYMQLKAVKFSNVPAHEEQNHQAGEAQKPLNSPVQRPTQH